MIEKSRFLRDRWGMGFMLSATAVIFCTLSASALALPAPGLPNVITPDFANAIGGIDLGLHAGLSAQVRAAAREQGVPPDLADAVATVETGYNPFATGSSGEIGLMQILPATALSMGFLGDKSELYAPETNIRFATQYLSRAWAMSGGNLCAALTRYRAGLAQTAFTPLSQHYCARANAYLLSIKSPLAQPGMIITAVYKTPDFTSALSGTLVPAWHRPYAGSWHPPHIGYHYHRPSLVAALQARFDSHRQPLYSERGAAN